MSPRLIRIAGWSLLAALITITAITGGVLARNATLANEQRALEDQLHLRAQSLQRLVERYRVLPTVLALDPELRAALQRDPAGLDVDALNHKLVVANGATHVSTLTLIDHNGLAIAASNWDEPASNVGQNYAFRPYFRDAMRDGSATFYAIGVTTNVAGYFISEAIRDAQGRKLGVVVVKITLDTLQTEWRESRDLLLLSDVHDIVFLASAPHWRYSELRPLTARDEQDLRDTRQYAGQALHLARMQAVDTLDDGDRRVQLRNPSARGLWLWKSLPLSEPHWTLHALRRDRSTAAGWSAAAVVVACWLPVILLGLFVRQRTRLAEHRRRSREELERMVAHHAEALRSAQDGLVDAARAAASGQGSSLEHLPQGVSVVDAQLRLVAWNARYQEMFQFPNDLMQVGRPIEDFFRHNARKGWLGPGQVEEAIQRRLDHLRSGGAHMHERELPNGTVLEIRGNPMPDGGFVTSFADITTYVAAARDLRTLASTLERRVEDSTADLRAATVRAENANRYKARFVAAAVHDLLQPLNAARMFLGVLRGKLDDGETRDLMQRAQTALSAQDDLLASMLEVSRLEAGVLQPRIEDIALGPLLNELAAQFGILAQAQGLTLTAVPTRTRVHTDPGLLRRVLQNFLSNALHNTPRGRVLLGCRRVSGAVRVEVWDTGVGIPENKRGAIFEEFERLDNGIRHDRRSAGLGLSIVERTARLLEHPLDLRSWPGRGSVFSITVPLATETAPSAPVVATAPATAAPLPLQGTQVWCVDDDAATREAMTVLLGSWGCSVQVAHDVASLTALAEQPAPDLVLLDLQLGQEHGPSLLERLTTHWTQPPPVVVISGQADRATREQAAEAGYGFLAKPVAPAALRAVVTQRLMATGRLN
ncbi:PAS/PAC sensor hybrid histidine kinase [Pseudoxanthomonas sp. GM95]|uniref:hybrid sensor histidine kinase/response regulator n=1 Tax=Pseudoxanthomonas sp. GM95 TaxID=1881043 RepID=UPI0008BF253A|nr:PAS-domain containing protein [Pseudoxanthomonas sp. GM95]SEM12264.1 PAS/PAC sensor hybrid histidine kinase [Pseudoxanthomonas sp. GM95]